MKKAILLPTIIFCSVLLANTAYGQKTDSVTIKQTNYYKTELSVPEKTAEQVLNIMNDYKAATKLLVNNKTYTNQQLKEKFDVLIDEKNSKLERILTEQQLQKIVPTTERK